MINSLFHFSPLPSNLLTCSVFGFFLSQLEQWEGFEAGDVITPESSVSPL